MPDMGKRFSHHTNRENPLTQYQPYLAEQNEKLGGTSAEQSKKILFFFAQRSVCTNFAQ